MDPEPTPRPESEQLAWEEHSLSQLRYFRSLSLREKMVAVQGMADVVRRFEEMRAKGEFVSAPAEKGVRKTSSRVVLAVEFPAIPSEGHGP